MTESEPVRKPPPFTGHQPRTCGDHRTVGPHRAWCEEDHEWCYPSNGCRGCEAPPDNWAIDTVCEAALLWIDSPLAQAVPEHAAEAFEAVRRLRPRLVQVPAP